MENRSNFSFVVASVQPATELEPLPPVQSWGENLRMAKLLGKIEIDRERF